MASRGSDKNSISLLSLFLVVFFGLNSNGTNALDPWHPVVACMSSSLNNIKLTPVCQYGEYIYNPVPEKCKNRTICYGGPRDVCSDRDERYKCHHRLSCTGGVCQGCVRYDPPDCYWPDLISKNSTHKRFGHRFLEYNT